MPQKQGQAQSPEMQNRSGIQPMSGIPPMGGFAHGLPEGANGSAITRDPKYGRAPGVYPVHVFGTYVHEPHMPWPPQGGFLNLCYIPSNVILSNFVIVPSGVGGILEDSLTPPTQYCNLAGAVTTMANMTAAQAQHLGSMYANTPRPIGPQGCAVLQWFRGTLLRIVGVGGAPPTVPLVYMIQWSPVYDAGV